MLAELGITTVGQIAALTPDARREALDAQLGAFTGPHGARSLDRAGEAARGGDTAAYEAAFGKLLDRKRVG